ncbi:MAG: RHS repeat-associated core domain-containing protein [Acidobacteriota bacterium]
MRFLFVFSLFTFFTAIVVKAQERQPARGFQFANSYSTNGFDAINVSNGNVIINLPLASLPAGRGTAPGFGVTLQYNSKLWDSRQETYTDGLPQGSQDQTLEPTYYYTTNKINLSDRGGWKLLTGYTPIITDRLNLESPSVCLHGDAAEKLSARWKMEVEFPDGSVREFVPVERASLAYEGYYRIDYNGVESFATRMTNPANGLCYVAQNTASSITTGMNYMTVDGSRLRLFVPYQSSNWKMYSPDGTVVEWSPPDDSTVGQRITDRNGNKVEIKGNQIVDQLGRSITLDENGVTVKGVNGESITTQIIWGTRWINRRYKWIDNGETVPTGVDRSRDINTSISTVEGVVMPSQLGGQSYTFDYFADTTQRSGTDYTDGWGALESMTLPSGAKSTYAYTLERGTETDLAQEILEDYVTQRAMDFTDFYDGSSTPRTETTYYDKFSGFAIVTNTDGSGQTERSYFNVFGPSWDSGLAFQTLKHGGEKIERIWKQNLPFNSSNDYVYAKPGNANAYVKTEFLSVVDSNGQLSKTSIKDFGYDKNGNVITIKEYDWVNYSDVPRNGVGPTGIPSLAPLKRITVNEYYNQSPAAESTTTSPNTYENVNAPKLLNVIKSSEIQDGNGTPISRNEFFYDDPDNMGNLTESRVWDSYKGGIYQPYSNPLTTSNSQITKVLDYDDHGNPLLTEDARGIQTQITYGSVSGFTGLYPTQTVAAYGTSVARTSSASYDFYTGAVTTATDVDNNVSIVTEYDPLGRPTKVKSAAGTALESWTRTEYDDINRRVIVRSDLETVGDGRKVATQFYDQLGRVRLSKTLEDAATQSATNETDGIKVETRYQTGNPNSYQITSNPFRAATATAAGNEPTMGWTRSKSWNHGRRSETETFSGAALPAPWGTNANSTGLSVEEEDANAETTTDEAGKIRRTLTDALGRMIRVDEPDANGNLGSNNSPNQPTNYSFDVLGNLTQIVQGGQTRSFGYSSLSRLLTATNPESGTFQFSYDLNGNLLTKVDARGISTTYTYDPLNRATTRNYSDSTPDIVYTYDDPQAPFSKGKLTRVSSSVSEARYLSYDARERITASRQTIDGQPYDFAYTYNLDGDLVTQTYPSGKVVQFAYDASGDLSQVSRQAASGDFVYANSFDYTAHGQVQKLRLGNGKWETTQFNSNRRITQIGLGHSASDTGFWKVNYDYGEWEGATLNAQKDNGNLARQTISVPTIGAATGFTAVQTYGYDSLDRLKSAAETIGSNQTWKQTFLFDRFGNKNFDIANTTIQSVDSAIAKITNPEILPTNNQFKQDQDGDSQPDYLFDASGNLTRNARDQNFTYDAENRQITATGPGLSTTHAYDGNGKRVKSHNAVTNQTTIFVHDAEGDLSAEYTINVPPPTVPTISYLTEDALGSVRVTTNSFGEIKARRDFLPFGEELYAGLAGRNANQKYSSNTDDTRKKFATYQRDAETNLDWAQSRYYSPMHGRFTSPDEFKGGPDELFDFEQDAADNPTFYADLSNPQSLNKYQYGYNNPYKFNDPTGHCPVCIAVIIVAAILTGPDYAVAPTGRESGEEMASYRNTYGGNALLNITPMKGAGLVTTVARNQLRRTAVNQTRNQAAKQTVKQTAKQTVKQPIKQATQKTTKLSKVSKSTSTKSVGGKFTKKTKVEPGRDPGQSRAEIVTVKTRGGRLIRSYKDTFDRANRFKHRKPLRGGPEGRPQE